MVEPHRKANEGAKPQLSQSGFGGKPKLNQANLAGKPDIFGSNSARRGAPSVETEG
ncbi:MAG: hypothetical protein NTV94_13635 [Planctomycetota bacterium]|nr:hypothetical protein [Planctomycetota bacterium]